MVQQSVGKTVSGVVIDSQGWPAPAETRICLGLSDGGEHACAYGPVILGSDGDFVFTDVAPGTYSIHIVTPVGEPCFASDPNTLKVYENVELRIVAPCLSAIQARYVVAGQVKNESGAYPPSGTTICLGSGTGGSHRHRYGPQTLSGTGGFSFSNVAAGTYTVCIKPPGGACCFGATPNPLEVRGNMPAVQITAPCL